MQSGYRYYLKDMMSGDGGMAYRKKSVVAGKTMEVEKYLLLQHPEKGRQREAKAEKTSDAQQKVNERNAARKLRLLVNENFGEGDLHLILTYREEAPTPEQAKEILRKFMRRMRKLYDSRGEELRYIAVTEYLSARIHHHLIVGRMDVGEIRKLWEHGFLRLSVLDDTGDYHALADYLIKETARSFRESPTKKRWTASRNLRRPEEKVETIRRKRFREPPPEKIGAFRLVHWENRVDEFTQEIHQVAYYRRI